MILSFFSYPIQMHRIIYYTYCIIRMMWFTVLPVSLSISLFLFLSTPQKNCDVSPPIRIPIDPSIRSHTYACKSLYENCNNNNNIISLNANHVHHFCLSTIKLSVHKINSITFLVQLLYNIHIILCILFTKSVYIIQYTPRSSALRDHILTVHTCYAVDVRSPVKPI